MSLLKYIPKTLGELNKILIKWEKKANRNNPLRLYLGSQNYRTLSDVLRAVAPYGKVCLICSQDYFDKSSKPVIRAIEGNGNKVVSIVGEDTALTIESLSKFFNIPEDVRAVVAFESQYISVASYLCSVKNLPLIFNCDKIAMSEMFPCSLRIKNGDKTDVVSIDYPRYVIFDRAIENSKIDAPELYAFNTATTIALTDYSIRCSLGLDEFNPLAYNLSKEAVTGAYKIIKDKEIRPSLLSLAIKNVVANYMTGGKLFEGSAVYTACRLAGESSVTEVLSRILGIYYLAFCGEYDDNMSYPDYNDRVSRLTEFGYSEKETLNWINYQLSVIDGKETELVEKFSAIKDTLKSQNSVMSTIKNTYIALGGKKGVDIDKINVAISLCGDVPNVFNGMTLAREKGFAELGLRLSE